MTIRRYDIAVIGGSLSAQIAAAMLAKAGQRVLFLRRREVPAPSWFHSSLFLEKLLALLGGRACFSAPQPIQVISRRARIVLHPDIPLTEELRRELGPAAEATLDLLGSLQATGLQLEELLAENNGLPWPSLKGASRFKLLSVRRKVKPFEFERPLSSRFDRLAEPARELLTDLFQGLALMPLKDISVAKAALLWTQAQRPEHLQEPDFSELLGKRLTQFHGVKDDLTGLATLDQDGRRWTGGRFQAGGRFEAKLFLLGDVRWSSLFAASLDATSIPKPAPVYQARTSNLDGQLSPLLEARVVCGGSLPLRLTLESDNDHCYGQVLGYGTPDDKDIRRQLEPVLPFARYELTPTEDLPVELAPGPAHESLFHSLPLKLSGNLYCADSSALLPGLGAAGAALLGWTLAENLASE